MAKPKKADIEKVNQELERRFQMQDCSWDCPKCGHDTEEQGGDSYDDDSHYKERECPTCGTRLTIVYRMHYQSATSSDGNTEYQSSTIETPWKDGTPLSVLATILHGLHMQQLHYQITDTNPYAQVIHGLVEKVDPTDWPKVLAGQYHEDLKRVAKHKLGVTDGA